MKKNFTSLLAAFTLTIAMVSSIFPATVNAESQFTTALKSKFYNFIVWAKANDWRSYDRFAVHDIDGDNIPEVLFGKIEDGSTYPFYDVVKYSNHGFIKLGHIDPSRYLMKDKYSHAILGLYGVRARANVIATQLSNYYIFNGTVQKNLILHSDSTNYYEENDITITKSDFENELFNYLGSYKELLVHDTFNTSVIITAVYTWKPEVFASPYSKKLNSTVILSKSWQKAFLTFINEKIGPADTYQAPYDDPVTGIRAEYTRFAFHDLDGNGVPELLLGVNHGSQVSFDVYRYTNADVVFTGSFDAYPKYIARISNSNDIFGYDPIPDLINKQTVSRLFYSNYATNIQVLMSIYPSTKNKSVNVVDILGKTSTLANFNKKLIDYVQKNIEIPTFDVEYVPVSYVLKSWRPQ